MWRATGLGLCFLGIFSSGCGGAASAHAGGAAMSHASGAGAGSSTSGSAGTTSAGAGGLLGGAGTSGGVGGTAGGSGAKPNVRGTPECDAYCKKLALCPGATCDTYSCLIRDGSCAAETRALLQCTIDTGTWLCNGGGTYEVLNKCDRMLQLCK